MTNELTRDQIEQLDLLHNSIFELFEKLSYKPLVWDIEWIGKAADLLTPLLVKVTGISEDELNPYILEE